MGIEYCFRTQEKIPRHVAASGSWCVHVPASRQQPSSAGVDGSFVYSNAYYLHLGSPSLSEQKDIHLLEISHVQQDLIFPPTLMSRHHEQHFIDENTEDLSGYANGPKSEVINSRTNSPVLPDSLVQTLCYPRIKDCKEEKDEKSRDKDRIYE